jgi:hypothetical protein
MQAAWNAFREEIVPDPPGSVGPIAANEARSSLGTELFIAAATSAAWTPQPSVTAAISSSVAALSSSSNCNSI